jgi:hypothetical protein
MSGERGDLQGRRLPNLGQRANGQKDGSVVMPGVRTESCAIGYYALPNQVFLRLVSVRVSENQLNFMNVFLRTVEVWVHLVLIDADRI